MLSWMPTLFHPRGGYTLVVVEVIPVYIVMKDKILQNAYIPLTWDLGFEIT